MKHINIDIKEKFKYFVELLHERKIVQSETIILKPKQNNIYWTQGASEVSHKTITEPLSLNVEKSNRESKYGIKLRCITLSNEPFFRFDSDGPAHRNYNVEVPINMQKIDTPHFNTFDETGTLVAYRTDKLNDEKECKEIIQDINFGIAHFCHESNMSLIDESYPVIRDLSPTLDFGFSDETNLLRVNFK